MKHKRDRKDNKIPRKFSKRDTSQKSAVRRDEIFFVTDSTQFMWALKDLKYLQQLKLNSLTFVRETLEHFKIELFLIGEGKQLQVLFQSKTHQYSKKDCFTGDTQIGNHWTMFRSEKVLEHFAKRERRSIFKKF